MKTRGRPAGGAGGRPARILRFVVLPLVVLAAWLAVPSFDGAVKKEAVAVVVTGESPAGADVSPKTVPFPLVYLSPLWNSKVILVGKSTEKLFVYAAEGGQPGLVGAFNVTTGKLGGDKVAEGDLKTPEGIYFPLEELDGERIGREYGVLAITLDYPNVVDRALGKGGSGIWIHATHEPLRSLTSQMTRGCVVLSNLSMLEVARTVRLRQTPVVILDAIETVPREETTALRDEVFLLVRRWAERWRGDARPGSDPISTRISVDSILRCRTYLAVSLYQGSGPPGEERFGKRFLYLRREAGSLQIVGESWLPTRRDGSPRERRVGGRDGGGSAAATRKRGGDHAAQCPAAA
jgi:hypothetical protein